MNKTVNEWIDIVDNLPEKVKEERQIMEFSERLLIIIRTCNIMVTEV